MTHSDKPLLMSEVREVRERPEAALSIMRRQTDEIERLKSGFTEIAKCIHPLSNKLEVVMLNLTCPHCGDENTMHDALADSSYNAELMLDGDTKEWDCQRCKKPMKISVRVTYDYSVKAAITEADAKYLAHMKQPSVNAQSGKDESK